MAISYAPFFSTTYANGTCLALYVVSEDETSTDHLRMRSIMKKYITTLVMMMMFAVTVPMLSGTVEAQRSYNSRSRSYQTRTYNNGYYQNGYYDNGYYNGRTSTYDRHRKAVNIGGGAAVGAILGALIGGGKGALIGAAVGAAGGAVVTSKQAPRNYYRYRY